MFRSGLNVSNNASIWDASVLVWAAGTTGNAGVGISGFSDNSACAVNIQSSKDSSRFALKADRMWLGKPFINCKRMCSWSVIFARAAVDRTLFLYEFKGSPEVYVRLVNAPKCSSLVAALPKADLNAFSNVFKSVNEAALSSYQMRGSSPKVNMNSLIAFTSVI